MGLFLSERPSRNKAYNNLAKNIRMTKFFSLKTINFVNYIFEKEKKKNTQKKERKVRIVDINELHAMKF